ncbi:MAG: DUF1192 domain-containing protein [Acetobacteraceae bacterium]|nr:DUF1192 domain-containing protein [Acetobacteraceae bacterium]
MFEEEARPRPSDGFEPRKLDNLGVEELRAYIAALQAEIARAEQAIAARDAQKKAADLFFRKPE